ncbi:hypothetical protein DFH06DRAFT_1122789 [Mycena polygramma]|nr:hypothetical protein DFH06DRAFT_1122789 [Mycena polygramma]
MPWFQTYLISKTESMVQPFHAVEIQADFGSSEFNSHSTAEIFQARECCQPELITFFYPTSTETIFMNRRPILAHSGKFSPLIHVVGSDAQIFALFLADTSDVDSAKGWASVTDPDLLVSYQSSTRLTSELGKWESASPGESNWRVKSFERGRWADRSALGVWAYRVLRTGHACHLTSRCHNLTVYGPVKSSKWEPGKGSAEGYRGGKGRKSLHRKV